jgi:hypothetical protein
MPRHRSENERGPGTDHPGDLDQNSQLDTGTRKGNPVHQLLDSFVGIEIDGGCPDCLAYQTIERVDVGIYVNRIHHDDTCPWWIRYQAATR